MKSSSPGQLSLMVNALMVGLAFSLLMLVCWRNREQIQVVLSQRLDLWLLGLAFLITQFCLLITFLRWFILVRVVEPRFAFRAALLLGFVGYIFNLVAPGAVGGDLVKVAYLSRMHIRKTQTIASTVIDRIVGLVGLLILAAVAGILAWEPATPMVRGLIVVAWGALALGVIVLVGIFSRTLHRLFPGVAATGCGRLATIMTELRSALTIYRRRQGVVLTALCLSVISHGLNVLVFFIIGKMLFSTRMTTPLAQHFLMAPLTFFTMAVPLPFGALGLTEEVGGQLFKLVGHPGGALVVMGLRFLALGCGLEAVCVYLANLHEVRALTASAHRTEVEPVADHEECREENPLSETDTLLLIER